MTISGYDCWKRKGLSRRRKLECRRQNKVLGQSIPDSRFRNIEGQITDCRQSEHRYHQATGAGRAECPPTVVLCRAEPCTCNAGVPVVLNSSYELAELQLACEAANNLRTTCGDHLRLIGKLKTAVFHLKLHFALRKSATKFLCVKTFSDKVVSRVFFRILNSGLSTNPWGSPPLSPTSPFFLSPPPLPFFLSLTPPLP